MKHVFLFDPKAFYNEQWKMDILLDGIGQFFRTYKKTDFSIQFSRYRRNAIGIIQEEAEKAKPGDIVRIYAIGGEEILFDCLNSIVHFPNMQLVIVPHSEENDFLKIFGDNYYEVFKDIPTLVNSESLPTDVIGWGVNYALNSCYTGKNSIVYKRLKDIKSASKKSGLSVFSKLFSRINYFFTAFDKQLAAREYNILIDNEDYSGQYSLIHVANNPYLNGKKTGLLHASPDDGLLDIALIKASHPLKTLISSRKYFKGKRPKNCIITQGKEISIQSNSPMWIQVDDEYIQNTSINLKIIHHAIQVVAPEGLSYPIGEI